MSELKELLIDNLKDLLNAENQIVGALPKMVEAADNNKLKEALEKHLTQTEGHVQRLQQALETLGARHRFRALPRNEGDSRRRRRNHREGRR